MTVAGWPVAFRWSHAVAAGLITRNRLRGHGFRRVYRDTYVRSGDELTLGSLVAYRYAAGRGSALVTRTPQRWWCRIRPPGRRCGWTSPTPSN